MKKLFQKQTAILFVGLSFFAVLTIKVNAEEIQWIDQNPSTYQYNYESYVSPNIDTVTTGCSGTGCFTQSNQEIQWIDQNPSTYQYNYESYVSPNIDTVTTGCVGCTTQSAQYVSPVGYQYQQYGNTSYGNTSSYVSPSYTYTNPTYTNSTYVNPINQVNVITCPSGSLVNGQCVNTINGTVITVTSCPTGTVVNGSNCVNTVNGAVVTRIVCPSGMNISGNQCVNTVQGNIVTNVVCSSGSLVNGQCVNTITPPVTTVTNCPSNTNYINGTCQQIINPPVVTYQTCWNGSVIPATSVCPSQYKVCANGTSIPVNQACYVAPTPVYVPPTVIKFNNVVTSVATQITNTSGRCNGIGLIANNAQSTGWFEYGETANLGRTTASAAIGSQSTAPFSNVLANLKPNTKYFCRAVMQNQYGIVKGEIVSFVTKSSVTTYVKPVVKAPAKKHVAPQVKKNEITCSDGTTVSVKSQSAATLINEGEKLVALQVEKTDGKLTGGSSVHYKISYKNLVDTRLTGVVIKVTIPQEITFVSTTAGTYDEGTRTLTLNQDTIDPYTEGIITLVGTVVNDAPIGKTIVTNVYTVYTVPGTKTQDEVTAYVVGSIVPATSVANQDTGAKKVVGMSSEKSFMPNSLIEWLALLAILFIIFILGRSIYASYKEDEGAQHH